MHRSSRDPDVMRQRLTAWLTAQLPSSAAPSVAPLQATSTNGMSSDTVLFEATWAEADGERVEPLVARIAPDGADVPVFPTYDLRRQYEVIKRVGELSTVPVPDVWWFEPSADALGAPFFVMGQVDGVVPPDVMPYTFGDNWLFDASAQDQRRLQDSTVAVLAELHRIDDAETRFDFLAFDDEGATPLRRHVAHSHAWYEYAAADCGPSALVERGFAWLDEHWPKEEGPTVVSWGDSRIGNVLYRDFEPVAVLDWEMAGLGPAELDVGWLINAHQTFEVLAATFELPGMPHFLRPEDVLTAYEAETGQALRDIDFYATYAAVQWGIVFLRTGRRQVHFGEREMPADVDDFLHNRAQLERMLA